MVAPGVPTGVDRRVDGLELRAPSNGVDDPEWVANGALAGDGPRESLVEAGMVKLARECVGMDR